MKNKLIRSLLVSTLIFSGCSATGTNQGLQSKSVQTELEAGELASVENEVQELKNRILKLESRLSSIKGTGDEPVIVNDGWKRLKNWRKLKTGMDYESVERILGPAHKIDGGIIANWYYKNDGRINFYEGSVQRWEEPN
ncbi:hypothetical protein [Marinobacter sp. AC-23]|uniref:hypothetical protein n=1 Tax=Marinobacter sp. AC-23 TaxID=1879031 RepID=UPI0011138301|nr:hypothetical protein [Marinobacter sp. AC-23]